MQPTDDDSRSRLPSPWQSRRRVWATTVGLHVADTGEPESTDGAAPLVVFVHGYPDTHACWEGIVRELAPTMRCVAYDLRGFGFSDKPTPVEAYTVDLLVDDLVAILDDLGASPERPVHLVGHDWGSVAMWEAAHAHDHDPRLTGRLASYTSISGPALAHVDRWWRRTQQRARHDGAARRELLNQAARSWYIGAFQVPRVPGMVLKQLTGKSLSRGNRRLREAYAGTLPDDLDHGTKLYRANMGGAASPRDAEPTHLPVHVIELTRDRYITAPLVAMADEFATDVTRVAIDASHWAPKTHSGEVAEAIAAFITATSRGNTPEAD